MRVKLTNRNDKLFFHGTKFFSHLTAFDFKLHAPRRRALRGTIRGTNRRFRSMIEITRLRFNCLSRESGASVNLENTIIN